MIDSLRICGFIVIFTVVCGAALEITDFVLTISYSILKFIIKVINCKCLLKIFN